MFPTFFCLKLQGRQYSATVQARGMLMCQGIFMVFVEQGPAWFAFPAPLCLHTRAHRGEVSGVVWRWWGQLQLPLPDWSAWGSGQQSSQ